MKRALLPAYAAGRRLFEAVLHRQRKTNDQLQSVELEANCKVISFDVFDTTLVRVCAVPAGIFDQVAKAVSLAGIAVPTSLLRDFRGLRQQAERNARDIAPGEEITLTDVYRAFATLTELSQDLCNRLAEHEIRVESESLRGVAETIDFVKRLAIAGKRILFISDMYLPRHVIEHGLATAGLPEGIGTIYLSNELSLTKRTGSLFRHILDTEELRPWELTHFGDNRSSDVAVPQEIGINAVRYAGCDLTRYERRFLATGGPVGEVLAGAMRAARMTVTDPNTPSGARRVLGANVAGPILIIFLAWVLHEARKKKISRLYFLARDGQFLIDLASQITARLGWDIELRYLYGSRQAWFLPAVSKLGEAELEWLLAADPILTIRLIAARIDLDPAIVAQEVGTLLNRQIGLDDELCDSEIRSLTLGLNRTRLPSSMVARATLVRGPMTDYLEQEQFFDNANSAIVDVGWFGRLQNSLRCIVDCRGIDKDLSGFYFGLWRNAAESNCRRNTKTSYFGPEPRSNAIPDARVPILMEIFTAADHGTTVGYERNPHGKWSPRLKSPDNPKASEWGLMDLRQGMQQLVDAIPTDTLELLAETADTLRPAVAGAIVDLLTLPSKAEADALGAFPFAIDQNEHRYLTLAPQLTPCTAIRYLLTLDGRKQIKTTLWIEGSRARSGIFTQILLCRTGFRIGGAWRRIRMIASRIWRSFGSNTSPPTAS